MRVLITYLAFCDGMTAAEFDVEEDDVTVCVEFPGGGSLTSPLSHWRRGLPLSEHYPNVDQAAALAAVNAAVTDFAERFDDSGVE
jgi:hypothetical protein